MNKIILIVSLLVNLYSYGQKDTTPVKFFLSTDTVNIKYSFTDFSFATFDSIGMRIYSVDFRKSDSTITIDGYKDTLSALWGILASYEYSRNYRDSMDRKKDDLISAAITWSNTVSDYFKKSKEWKQLAATLRKNGYVIKKTK